MKIFTLVAFVIGAVGLTPVGADARTTVAAARRIAKRAVSRARYRAPRGVHVEKNAREVRVTQTTGRGRTMRRFMHHPLGVGHWVAPRAIVTLTQYRNGTIVEQGAMAPLSWVTTSTTDGGKVVLEKRVAGPMGQHVPAKRTVYDPTTGMARESEGERRTDIQLQRGLKSGLELYDRLTFRGRTRLPNGDIVSSVIAPAAAGRRSR